MARQVCPATVARALALVLALAPTANAQENRAAKQSGDAGATPAITDHITLIADRDDDDLDDRADALAEVVTPAARVDLVVLEARYAGSTMSPAKGQEHARLIGANGKVIAWNERIPAGAMLQGVSAGRVVLTLRTAQGKETGLAIDVHGVSTRDGQKHAVDMASERASLDRTPPARVDLEDAEQIVDDPDALRFVLSSPEGASLGPLTLESLAADSSQVDSMEPKFTRAACDAPKDTKDALVCVATAPIRLVADDVDRRHPLVSTRSLKAEVGGAIVLRDAKGKKLQAIRIAGPRHTNAGALGRYRVSIRPIVMRLTQNGAPSVGGNDAGAVTSLKQELSIASATWGQCGLSFDPNAQVKLTNPPPAYLVALGDDVGLPAAGGDVELKVEGKAVRFTLKPNWSTRQAALELQKVATAAGFKAAISENARISSGASPSVDVLLRKADNSLANAEIVSTTEKTMAVRIGSVDLSDGLQHFGDTDSVAGTIEERALVKAVDDGDPRTIEVIIVPFFGGGGRIGESFIGSDGSSMRNVVILDRAGVRARRTSLTLAHELGHVILDEPGHPDDYGVDTPTLLMDSDASDASPFGPRRISNDECARAVRQSGPNGRIPLLTDWKLGPMRYGK